MGEIVEIEPGLLVEVAHEVIHAIGAPVYFGAEALGGVELGGQGVLAGGQGHGAHVGRHDGGAGGGPSHELGRGESGVLDGRLNLSLRGEGRSQQHQQAKSGVAVFRGVVME